MRSSHPALQYQTLQTSIFRLVHSNQAVETNQSANRANVLAKTGLKNETNVGSMGRADSGVSSRQNQPAAGQNVLSEAPNAQNSLRMAHILVKPSDQALERPFNDRKVCQHPSQANLKDKLHQMGGEES